MKSSLFLRKRLCKYVLFLRVHLNCSRLILKRLKLFIMCRAPHNQMDIESGLIVS